MDNRREFLLSTLGFAAFANVLDLNAQSFSKVNDVNTRIKLSVPTKWQRKGIVISRSAEGHGSSVVGDPCIVWDDEIEGWRMFIFYEPPGCGQAICPYGLTPEPGNWKVEGALQFTNPKALFGGVTQKPFIVMNAYEPNRAAKIDGHYRLLTVSFKGRHKLVQESICEKLSGPWTVLPGALIENGVKNDFDAKHADAVTGFYFPEKDETLYFYMGYPQEQQSRKYSQWGNAQGAAIRRGKEVSVTKLGEILPPHPVPGHWASGWVGGLQLLPGKIHKWIALVNASPTPPQHGDTSVFNEEPPPSLGGFAYCDEDWPVKGWHFLDKPIEYIEDIPKQARALGEGTNFWRQYLLVLPHNKLALYYNSGYYGKEQLYMKLSDRH